MNTGANMASFDAAWSTVFGHEGGEANHPDDPGRHTMHGVTEAVARRHGYRIEDVTPEIARKISKIDYWDDLGLDHVQSQRVATKLLDVHYSSGWGAIVAQLATRTLATLRKGAMRIPAADRVHIEIFERLSIEAAIDGAVGAVTLGALNAVARTYEDAVVHELSFWHAARHHGMRRNEAVAMVHRIETEQAWRDSFLRGWVTRDLEDLP